MIFKNIIIFFRYIILFASLIDNSWRYLTKDSEGYKSFVCHRDKKMIKAIR